MQFYLSENVLSLLKDYYNLLQRWHYMLMLFQSIIIIIIIIKFSVYRHDTDTKNIKKWNYSVNYLSVLSSLSSVLSSI